MKMVRFLLIGCFFATSCGTAEDLLSSQESALQQKARRTQAKHVTVFWPEEVKAQKMLEETQATSTETLMVWPPPIYIPPIPPVPPTIQLLAGTAPVSNPASAATHGFAIAEIQIQNFWKCSPPEVRIYDHDGGTTYWLLKWGKPSSQAEAESWGCWDAGGNPVLTTETRPVPLAPDPNPYARTNHVPLARLSRMELWHMNFGTTSTAYLRLGAGIYVVPVYYREIAISSIDLNKMIQRRIAVTDAFWTVPTTYIDHGDVNSIWKQADVQFHLTGTSYYLFTSGASNVNTALCSVGWSPSVSVSDAVDIYGVDTIDGDTSFDGWGQCYPQGWVAVRAPALSNPGLLPLDNGRLIAHEFGHYCGGLGHPTGYVLMNIAATISSLVTSSEVTQMRTIISQRVYSDATLDYHKNL